MRIHLSALGCKLNQSEMERLARQLVSAGHQVVADPAEADLCICNTCTVTHIAARKSRQALRQLRRSNARASLVATGCYAEISPQETSETGEVNWVVGNADKDRLFELLAARIPGFAGPSSAPAPADLLAQRAQGLPRVASRTRAFVKIQDGCDNACAYCIVSKARGPARSYPAEHVLAEIQDRLAEGYQEVVLTGVHIGSYGREWGSSLAQLVQEVLQQTAVPRLRLSSIEPWDFSAELAALWQDRRLCRHLHLPLQSGCDATLARMNRKYTAAQYAGMAATIRAAIPQVALTTDVIVGFPGETDDEFQASLEFVRQQGYAKVHVFKYSLREGTAAAAMAGQLPPEVKETRSRLMHRVGEQTARQFQASLLGQVLDVLWETSPARGPQGLPLWSGLTDNYVRVELESAEALANTITRARLAKPGPRGLEAESAE